MPSANPTHFFIWSVGEDAAAKAYVDACNVAIKAIDPTAVEWYPTGWRDANGCPVAAKLGPPWRWGGKVFEEPKSCADLHSGATEQTDWVRPPPEDG